MRSGMEKHTGKDCQGSDSLFLCAAAHISKGLKSQIRPISGKRKLNTKDVCRETETKERYRQISDLTKRILIIRH